MGNNSILATNESLYKHINYTPERDFIPITLIGTQANILVVNADVPARSLKELIALAKDKPGTLDYASAGKPDARWLRGAHATLAVVQQLGKHELLVTAWHRRSDHLPEPLHSACVRAALGREVADALGGRS